MANRILFLMLGLALAFSAAAADADRMVWIGGHKDISEAVQGPLVAVGGDITVSAPVAGSVKLAGGKLTIAPGAVISGDVDMAGGDLTMDGSVGGHLHAGGGHVRINGPVTGDASIAAGTLELGPDARIQGKLTFRGGEMHRDDAAQVLGGVERKEGRLHTGWHDYDRTPTERFLHGWIWTIGLMVLAAIIAAALPGPSSRMAGELRQHPWITLGIGFVALVAVPIAGVLLMFTIIGIPIALLVLMAYGVLLLAGYVWLAVVVGGLLLDRVRPDVAALAAWRAGAAVLAMLVIALLVRVPYVGGTAHFIALMLGMGMIAAVIFRRPDPPQAVAP